MAEDDDTTDLASELRLERGRHAETAARLHGMERRVQRLVEYQQLAARFFEVQRSLRLHAPLEETLNAIALGGQTLLAADFVTIRVQEAGDARVALGSAGLPEGSRDELASIPLTEGLAGRALDENRVVIADGYESFSGEIRSIADDVEVVVGAAVPMDLPDPVTGVIWLGSTERGREFGRAERDMLRSVATYTAMVIGDAVEVDVMRDALHDATYRASHDSLTALYNRSAVTRILDRGLADPPDEHSMSVLFVDLDRFRAINGELGHKAGDLVLIEMAERQAAAAEAEAAGRLLATPAMVEAAPG
jgi:GGDEF domain-containing protein